MRGQLVRSQEGCPSRTGRAATVALRAASAGEIHAESTNRNAAAMATSVNRRPQRWTMISSLRMFCVGLEADEQHEHAQRHNGREERVARGLHVVGRVGPAGYGRHCRLGCGLAHLDQTFSTSGRPRMPVGLKISTIARMEKVATSL